MSLPGPFNFTVYKGFSYEAEISFLADENPIPLDGVPATLVIWYTDDDSIAVHKPLTVVPADLKIMLQLEKADTDNLDERRKARHSVSLGSGDEAQPLLIGHVIISTEARQ